jgi:hypothetical protein
MTAAEWSKTGTLRNPNTPFGLRIGTEIIQSARRHLWRMYLKHRQTKSPRGNKPFFDADHILMHLERADGTCSQCPAYMIGKGARRA